MSTCRNILPCILAFTLLAAPAAAAERASEMAPPDTGVYLEIDNLAKLRAEWERDPLAAILKEFQDKEHNPVWEEIQVAMQLSGEQIIDTYFGKHLALVGTEPGDHKPVVILSRVPAKDGDLAVERLQLKAGDPVGAFKVYASDDDEALFAFGNGWMAIAGSEHREYMKKVLSQTDAAHSLATDKQFNTWMEKLPSNRIASAFARDPRKDETHAVAVVKKKRDLTIHYHGKTPDLPEAFAKLGDARRLEFGPLPAGTVAAVCLNLHDDNGKQHHQMMDQLLAPKTFKDDVLPKLGLPAVLFVAETKAASENELPLPAVGVAIKLKDATVKADLDRMGIGMVTFINLAVLAAEAQPAALREVEFNNATYHSADYGAALAKMTERNELKNVQLTFGRIGSWYIVCSNEELFKQCAAAEKDAFARPHRRKGMTPMARALIKTHKIAGPLAKMVDHLEEHPLPDMDEKGLAGLEALSRIMKHVDLLDVELHRGPDDTIVGKMEIKRTRE